MPESEIYLSVVVTARNDDHGGSLLSRMQAFVNGWIGQCQRHGLAAELIVVDWNPPANRPPLIDALHWPPDTHPCQVRFIQVPPEIHRQFRHAAHLPLYQMIAKNVGIRSARGRFILVTNIDILFSDELVAFLAARRLQPGRMYRIDRHDVMSDVPVNGSVDEQLAYCANHLIRVNAREGTFSLTPEGRRAPQAQDIATPDSGIAFGRGWYGVEGDSSQELFRWVANDAEVVVKVPPGFPALVFNLAPGPGVNRKPFVLEVLNENSTVVARTRVRGRCDLALQLPPAAGETQRFFLRVRGGGLPIAEDPRILNFRVYRCGWAEVPVESKPPGEGSAKASGYSLSFKPAGATSGASGLRRRLRQFMLESGRRDPETPMTITLPTMARHALHAYYTKGGILGVARLVLQTFRRPRHLVAVVPAGYDIFDPESNILPGQGWYDLEHYAGETFRWARNDAEVIVRRPKGNHVRLAMHIEPGPGVDWKPFELVVRDGERIIAAAKVEKLQRLEVPLPLEPDQTHALKLHLEGGDRPFEGDARRLNFRLFWCGWIGASTPSDELSDWIPTGREDEGRQQADESNPVGAVHLHTNACGDFTLMARERWFDLRGYPEFDLYSFHIDSILCYAAHYGGAPEEILREPMRIYHIEHGQGSGWTPEGQAKLFDRLRANGISWIEYQELVVWAAQMRKLNSPFIFNRENWGLAGVDLPEMQLPRNNQIAG